jgi:hypothetical protein
MLNIEICVNMLFKLTFTLSWIFQFLFVLNDDPKISGPSVIFEPHKCRFGSFSLERICGSVRFILGSVNNYLKMHRQKNSQRGRIVAIVFAKCTFRVSLSIAKRIFKLRMKKDNIDFQ